MKTLNVNGITLVKLNCTMHHEFNSWLEKERFRACHSESTYDISRNGAEEYLFCAIDLENGAVLGTSLTYNDAITTIEHYF